jgi:hypothetical protein
MAFPRQTGDEAQQLFPFLMFIGSGAYLDGAGPFFDFTRDEFLQIIP